VCFTGERVDRTLSRRHFFLSSRRSFCRRNSRSAEAKNQDEDRDENAEKADQSSSPNFKPVVSLLSLCIVYSVCHLKDAKSFLGRLSSLFGSLERVSVLSLRWGSGAGFKAGLLRGCACSCRN
jgi:hypothetical protein